MTTKMQSNQFSAYIFNCVFCGYQSNLNLAECPGCGRISRALSPVKNRQSIETRYLSNQRSNRGKSNRLTKFLQIFGVSLFYVSALVYLGIGVIDLSFDISVLIARFGENWIWALFLDIAGFIIISIGNSLEKQ